MTDKVRLPWPDVEIDPSAVIELSMTGDATVRILIQEPSGAVATVETLWSPEIDELMRAIRQDDA